MRAITSWINGSPRSDRCRRTVMAACMFTISGPRCCAHCFGAARTASVDVDTQRVVADVIVAVEGVQAAPWSWRIFREVSRSDVTGRHRNIRAFPDARRWTSMCSCRAGCREATFPISGTRHDRDLSTPCTALRSFVLRYFLRSNHSTTGGNVNISVTGAINAYAMSCPVAVPAINPRIAVTIIETGFNSTR